MLRGLAVERQPGARSPPNCGGRSGRLLRCVALGRTASLLKDCGNFMPIDSAHAVPLLAAVHSCGTGTVAGGGGDLEAAV